MRDIPKMCLVLGPLFWECPHLRALPYTDPSWGSSRSSTWQKDFLPQLLKCASFDLLRPFIYHSEKYKSVRKYLLPDVMERSSERSTMTVCSCLWTVFTYFFLLVYVSCCEAPTGSGRGKSRRTNSYIRCLQRRVPLFLLLCINNVPWRPDLEIRRHGPCQFVFLPLRHPAGHRIDPVRSIVTHFGLLGLSVKWMPYPITAWYFSVDPSPFGSIHTVLRG